ncbi:hypothetical protein [Fusobacterium sp. HMSC073F01]|uniref:hypothetical protein n=1 Tax=Fusobacterium sp. HMSC073F01 TaxID=1739251 RepID=UPI0008A267D4|nr:hypothetical protein [Fusobacterium sp. HMSC073F01]OFL94324.1 hypothetical protein HMPREF2747_16095 [Fusobacterium sp. HMSC073F01]
MAIKIKLKTKFLEILKEWSKKEWKMEANKEYIELYDENGSYIMTIKNVLKFKVLDITYIFQCERKKIEEIMSEIEFTEKTNEWD